MYVAFWQNFAHHPCFTSGSPRPMEHVAGILITANFGPLNPISARRSLAPTSGGQNHQIIPYTGRTGMAWHQGFVIQARARGETMVKTWKIYS
jgi:hypothetical protein